MPSDELQVLRDGEQLTCVINREGRRNALSSAVVSQLKATLEEAERDPGVRLICLTGAGDRAFSAGGDLAGDLGSSQSPEDVVQGFAELLVTMDRLGKPLLARVNGLCMGGGLGLVLACDLAVAVDDARFGLPEVRVGLFPMIIAPLLLRHCGPKRAMEMIFTARHYSAQQALQLGLVNAVVPRAELDSEVRRLSEEIRGNSPAAISQGRTAISRARHLPLGEAAAMLARELLSLMQTEDVAEGISAFLEKRRPQWKGR